MTVDLHQHLWTPQLLQALEARDSLPLVRSSGGVVTLHIPGDRPYPIDRDASSAAERARLLAVDGARRAVVALSSPIGIEALPRGEALALISAHLDGVLALGDPFLAWGPVPTAEPDPDDVDEVLRRGCVGVSLPAGALATPAWTSALQPVLERLQSAGAPLFVHPGPVAGPEASDHAPVWWRALTDYVAQMQAAWLAFVAFARPRLPRLRVVFSMLAGGAPLLAERLALRGGPEADLTDPLTFYDTSGSGRSLIDAVARAVGPERLVYGSDRPVVEPPRSADDARLMRNAERLLSG